MTDVNHLSRARSGRGQGLIVLVGSDSYPLLSCDASGFEISAEVAPLPGHVEIHQGGRMVRSALIVVERVTEASARYTFKRSTLARSAAPTDFAPGMDIH